MNEQMKSVLSTLLCLLLTLASATAQESGSPGDSGLSLDGGTIRSQFDYLFSKSNNFQEYKVVKRTWLDKLQFNVTDSLDKLESELEDMKKARAAAREEVASLGQAQEQALAELQKAKDTKNSISFLGIPTHKNAYNGIMWALVLLLTASLLFFIYRFKRGHVVTSKTLRDLEELREEYDTHRKKALERERKLNRRLQDELNKQLK